MVSGVVPVTSCLTSNITAVTVTDLILVAVTLATSPAAVTAVTYMTAVREQSGTTGSALCHCHPALEWWGYPAIGRGDTEDGDDDALDTHDDDDVDTNDSLEVNDQPTQYIST